MVMLDKYTKIKMENITSHLPYNIRWSLDVPDDNIVIEVIQWEVWVIWNDEKKSWTPRYIETRWAGPCIIVTAHNPETGKTCLAHIDAMHSIFMTMWAIWKSQIRIIGWWKQSIIDEAVEAAKTLGMSILEIDWPTNGNNKSIIIDSETGIVYDLDSAKKRTRPRVQELLTPIGIMGVWMEASLYNIKTWQKPACQWVYWTQDSWIKTYIEQDSFHGRLLGVIE